jgi:hypothetical protein
MGFWLESWGDEPMIRRTEEGLQFHPLLRALIVVVPLSIGGLYAWWDVQGVAQGNSEKIAEVTVTLNERGNVLHAIKTEQSVLRATFETQAQADREAQKRIEAQLDRIIRRLDRTTDN